MAVALAVLFASFAAAAQADTARGTWNIYGERNASMLEMHWHSVDGSSSEDHGSIGK